MKNPLKIASKQGGVLGGDLSPPQASILASPEGR